MMNSKRLHERQAAMKARRGKRPWDERHEEAAGQFILSMHTMFRRGYTDEFIAQALDLDPVLIGMLRTSKRQRLNRF
jgi:hypothetical protein